MSHRWQLSFRLPPLRRDLRITGLAPLFSPSTPKQDCWVYLNGFFVYFCSIAEACELSFAVARESLNRRINRLSFVLPDATPPKELNHGEDMRKLGLAFTRLTAAQN